MRVRNEMKAALAALALLVLVALAGCDPVKGQGCSHEGNVYSHNGQTLTCTRQKDGSLKWA